MLGPVVNSVTLVAGGISGAALGRRIPRRVREAMPLTCGIVSVAVGTALMNKVHAIPAVALALLAGAFIGELLFLERGLELAIGWARRRVEKMWPAEQGNHRTEDFVAKYVTVLVLFSASGMGIFGAMHEGMTGDANILIAKAILDLFTATIFATELGYAVILIAIPQMAIQGLLYASASLVLPMASPNMLADFSASGGVIMLATGLRVCGIKIFPIVNMLPALLLVMPCSALWSHLFA
ncbi:MAG: DUF554 domain-containing protein [Actinomycetota bacterium]